MANLVQTQLRAISALGVREINSQQANLMYGYAWALVDAVLSVGGLLLMKLLLRAFNPPGLPPATYILSGALPWFMWTSLYGSTSSSIAKNKRLLSLPVFTELDFAIGGSLQIVMTYAITMVVCTTISSALENAPFPKQPLGILLMLFAIWVEGVSFGLVLTLVYRIYAPAAKFVGFVLRFSLFLCGVYIPITRFPTYIWPYLDWIPMLHIEELIRQYWFANYVSPVGNPWYVLWCTLGMAAFGLACERYCRRRLPVT
jgi:capsular polysaccharide transport system permease protein